MWGDEGEWRRQYGGWVEVETVEGGGRGGVKGRREKVTTSRLSQARAEVLMTK